MPLPDGYKADAVRRALVADLTLKVTNRLLRQYLPKRTDLRDFSLRDLDNIAAEINARPRRVLNGATAAELYWLNVRSGTVT